MVLTTGRIVIVATLCVCHVDKGASADGHSHGISLWATRAFFNRMDLENNTNFDPYLWEGYLWSPRVTDDLFVAFKELFLKVLRNLDRIPKRVRNHGPQLFIHTAIPPNRHITTDESKGILYNLKPNELGEAAGALQNILVGAGDKSPVLWKETIGPWFKQAWPGRGKDKSKKLSDMLCRMAINSGDAFPDIVHAIEKLILPEEWGLSLRQLMKKENEANLVSRFPDAALILADKLVDDKSHVTGKTLRDFLDTVLKAQPGVKKSAGYKRLLLRI